LERGDIAITFKGDLLCPFLQYFTVYISTFLTWMLLLNALVRR